MIEYNGNIAYGEKLLCIDVRLRLHGGECVLLCGANGSGKSTLMRSLAEAYPKEIMLIPTGIPKVKGFTLDEFIRTGCYGSGKSASKAGRDLRQKRSRAVERLGMAALLERDISTLSDGEFQKACIAIGLCSEKRVLMLDEPTAFLDPKNRIAVLSCLQGLAEDGHSIVFSSHDIGDSLLFCNTVWAIGRDLSFHNSGTCRKNDSALRESAATVFSENTYLYADHPDSSASARDADGAASSPDFQ